jgi:hypothetical protein
LATEVAEGVIGPITGASLLSEERFGSTGLSAMVAEPAPNGNYNSPTNPKKTVVTIVPRK